MLAARMSRTHWLFFVVFAAAVLGAVWAIGASRYFLAHPGVLGPAIAGDLVVVVPAVYWWVVVRRRLAPARTAIPVVALGLLAATAVMPAGHTGVLTWARYLWSPAEIGLLAYVAWKVRAILRSRSATSTDDPVEAAAGALEAALGSAFAARLIATEFAVLYYALSPARRPAHVPEGAVGFAPARAGVVLVVLLPVVALETALVHAMVSRWSVGAAWVLTGLSAYTVLWLMGDYRAMRRRPILVTEEGVIVRVGLRCRIRASHAQIERVAGAGWRDDEAAVGRLNMASPDSPNVVISFREPVVARRFFGIETAVRSVGVRVVDGEGLIGAVRRGMGT